MDILFSTASHGAIISATNSQADLRAVASLPMILEASDSPVQEQARALREAVDGFAAATTGAINIYTEAARGDHLRKAVTQRLSRPVQQLISAGQAEQRAISASWLRVTAVPTADATTAMLRQSDRATFSALGIGDKAAWIERASIDELEAIIEAGSARAMVTPEIWQRAEHRYAALNHIRISGAAAGHAVKPSAQNPLAMGVDTAAVAHAADAALARYHQRSEIVEAIEQVVQGITNVVAIVCDLNVDDAFALLVERTAS